LPFVFTCITEIFSSSIQMFHNIDPLVIEVMLWRESRDPT
jgi:hypothetical protein